MVLLLLFLSLPIVTFFLGGNNKCPQQQQQRSVGDYILMLKLQLVIFGK